VDEDEILLRLVIKERMEDLAEVTLPLLLHVDNRRGGRFCRGVTRELCCSRAVLLCVLCACIAALVNMARGGVGGEREE